MIVPSMIRGSGRVYTTLTQPAPATFVLPDSRRQEWIFRPALLGGMADAEYSSRLPRYYRAKRSSRRWHFIVSISRYCMS
jgi:hypothetical protein